MSAKPQNQTRHYYAAHSYMGLDYTYDSPCWVVYKFYSKADRDLWLTRNEYNGQQYVAEAVSARTANRIRPADRHIDMAGYSERENTPMPW